ncbi:unnamed protein product [Protopolystoma xenopodis]|uniref:Uncharacterized protein n=1 Tax=Protopolystoma xenopodis TaxID=117903 RepID=A0A3S5AHT1_9PLAT|nr:unnamed protein product [Protopolystoma xenopodis]
MPEPQPVFTRNKGDLVDCINLNTGRTAAVQRNSAVLFC